MSEYVLCTMGDVKGFTKIGAGFTNYDANLIAAISIASDQIIKFVGQPLANGPKVQYAATPQSAAGAPTRVRLTAPNVNFALPIVVKFDATGRFGAWATTLVKDYDYTVREHDSSILLLGEWGYTPRGIQIEYTAGYQLAADPPNLLQVPANLRNAAAMQAAFLFNRIQSGSLGKSAEEKENMQITYTRAAANGLLGEVKAMISSARMPMVGRS